MTSSNITNSRWQPIKTAPKDTQVLAYWCGAIVQAAYEEAMSGDYYWYEGHRRLMPDPTHWTNLLEPPEEP